MFLVWVIREVKRTVSRPFCLISLWWK